MQPSNKARKAWIATAIVLLSFGLFAAPTAVAEEEPNQNQGNDDGDGVCYDVNLFVFPPAVDINPEDCI